MAAETRTFGPNSGPGPRGYEQPRHGRIHYRGRGAEARQAAEMSSPAPQRDRSDALYGDVAYFDEGFGYGRDESQPGFDALGHDVENLGGVSSDPPVFDPAFYEGEGAERPARAVRAHAEEPAAVPQAFHADDFDDGGFHDGFAAEDRGDAPDEADGFVHDPRASVLTRGRPAIDAHMAHWTHEAPSHGEVFEDDQPWPPAAPSLARPANTDRLRRFYEGARFAAEGVRAAAAAAGAQAAASANAAASARAERAERAGARAPARAIAPVSASASWEGGAEALPQGALRPAAVQKLINGAGAVTSLVLICGLALWGYKLAVRDVTGIPVIKAIEGPARVAPEDPGGELAQHTGLSVNAVAAFGEAAAPAETLKLAPAVITLTDDDLPMGKLDPAIQAPDRTRGAVEEPDQQALRGHVPPEPLPEDAPEPILGADPAAEGTPAPAPISAGPVISAAIPGVSTSPFPRERPGSVAYAEYQQTLPKFAEVDAASLSAGTRLVQLGAFETEQAASDEWLRIARTYGALLNGKGRVIQAAESGGKSFYRLRASGFEDIDDARRFCAAIVDKTVRCIPVVVR